MWRGDTFYQKTGCNSGYHESNGSCVPDCTANSCSGYTLSSCPTNGNCSSCSKQTTACTGGGTVYKLDSCAEGYKMSGNSCVKENTCSQRLCAISLYNLGTCPENGICSSCTPVSFDCKEGNTVYKLDSCKEGYTKSGDTCVKEATCVYEDTCSGYTFTSCSIGTPEPCTACGITKYKCNLTIVNPPDNSCGTGMVRLQCGNSNCCCPKDRGCDNNSQLKWCTCEYPGGAIDPGISIGGGTIGGIGGGGSGIDGCAAYQDNCSDYCKCMKDAGRLGSGPGNISTSTGGNLATGGSPCRCSADGNPM